MDVATAVTICQWAAQSNLVHGYEIDSSKRLEKQSEALQHQKWMGWLNPISIKLKLLNPDKLMTAVTPSFGWLFSKTFLLGWILTGLFALSILRSDWDKLSAASIGILSGWRWLWLLIVWAVLKVVHEAGHGIACKRYGGTVNEAGILLLLFTPLAFVNVTSSWRFSNRWHRIVVASAGMYVELFISFLALIIWSYTSDGIVTDICYNVFLMSSVTTVLFNANPLMRFDGYYILADGLGITNLYTKGSRLFTDWLRYLFFGLPGTPNVCPKHEIRIAFIYGSMAFFWRILISVSLIIGASVLFYGAGKLMAFMGIVLFFGFPIWSQFKQLFGAHVVNKPDTRRVAISFGLSAMAILSLFYLLQAPATKSAPAIVQYKDETLVRAEVDGFIEDILVHDGQSVAKGQTLMVLRNPEIDIEICRLQNEADAAKIKARVYEQDSEISMSLAESEKYEGILKQLAEKNNQAKSLNVVAPFDGFVFQRNLDSKIGSFVKRGDNLLNMAQEQSKEIVVTIDQREWESLKGKLGTSMRVVMNSVSVFSSKVEHIDARASDVPSHLSLCAVAGGPLAIKQGSRSESGRDPQYKLLTPHFTVDLQLSREVSEKLNAGQRGRAFFAAERQSLGGYFFVVAEDWLKKKLQRAIHSAAF